jgi:hypothetical protein
MKIRNGFVSNSSSSSFLIYGTTIDTDDVKQILKNNNIEVEKYEDPNVDKEEIDEEDDFEDDFEEEEDFYENFEALGKLLGKDDLTCEGVCDDQENIYIGASWSSVKDDETGLQFKTRVEKAIEKLLGKKVTCETLAEA